MCPIFEAVDHVGESGDGLREIGGADLGGADQADDLGAGSGADDQRLHLLGSEVLDLVQDDVFAQEGMPLHEVEGGDANAIAQQVIGCCSTPSTHHSPSG